MELFQKLLDLDRDWFFYLNQFHSGFWDTVMLLVTRKELWLPLYITIVYFIFSICRGKGILIVFFLIVAVLVSDQVSVLIKDLVQRLRPVHNPEIQHLVHNVLRKGGLYGFPSSHAANSFAILVFTSAIFRNKGYFFLLLIWALLISYSRIYAGVHYPLDVLAGMILGILVGFGFYKLTQLIESHLFIIRNPKIKSVRLKGNQAGSVYLIFLVLISTLLIVTWILHHYHYL